MTIKKAIKFIAYKPMALLMYPPLKMMQWLDNEEHVTFRQYWDLVTHKNDDENED